MTAGRPTLYTPELLESCNEYLKTYTSEGDVIPSHIGLFLFIGISKTCGYDWAKDKDKKEFAEILEKCNMLQQQVLINKGLTGEFNSNIAKLALGKHGYHDKQETDITSGGEKIKNEWHMHPVANGKD